MVFNLNLFMLLEKYTSESMSSVIVHRIKSSSGTLKLVQISHICMCVSYSRTIVQGDGLKLNAEGGA